MQRASAATDAQPVGRLSLANISSRSSQYKASQRPIDNLRSYSFIQSGPWNIQSFLNTLRQIRSSDRTKPVCSASAYSWVVLPFVLFSCASSYGALRLAGYLYFWHCISSAVGAPCFYPYTLRCNARAQSINRNRNNCFSSRGSASVSFSERFY